LRASTWCSLMDQDVSGIDGGCSAWGRKDFSSAQLGPSFQRSGDVLRLGSFLEDFSQPGGRDVQVIAGRAGGGDPHQSSFQRRNQFVGTPPGKVPANLARVLSQPLQKKKKP
jgi:hypothetical protein